MNNYWKIIEKSMKKHLQNWIKKQSPKSAKLRNVDVSIWQRTICLRQTFLVRGGLHIKTHDGFGSVRDLFGVRSGFVRGPFGIRLGSVRDPVGPLPHLFGVRFFFVGPPSQPKEKRSPAGHWGGAGRGCRTPPHNGRYRFLHNPFVTYLLPDAVKPKVNVGLSHSHSCQVGEFLRCAGGVSR